MCCTPEEPGKRGCRTWQQPLRIPLLLSDSLGLPFEVITSSPRTGLVGETHTDIQTVSILLVANLTISLKIYNNNNVSWL